MAAGALDDGVLERCRLLLHEEGRYGFPRAGYDAVDDDRGLESQIGSTWPFWHSLPPVAINAPRSITFQRAGKYLLNYDQIMKLGQCQIQNRPLGIKTGQYLGSTK